MMNIFELYFYILLFIFAGVMNAQTPTSSPTFAIQTFSYMSSSQTYSVPVNANLFLVVLYGGKGADYSGYTGGEGGITTATIYLPSGTATLYILCGGNDGTNGG